MKGRAQVSPGMSLLKVKVLEHQRKDLSWEPLVPRLSDRKGTFLHLFYSQPTIVFTYLGR